MEVQSAKPSFYSVTLKMMKEVTKSTMLNPFTLKVTLMLKDVEEGWSLDDLFRSMGSVQVADGPAKPLLVGLNPM